MKAIVQDHYGSTDQLRLAEVPDPVAGPGEVLVRVGAAGVDRGTWHADDRPAARRPARARPAHPEGPHPGPRRRRHRRGARRGRHRLRRRGCRYGTARGSFAELAVVPITRLARRPANLSVEEAAAVPVSALTAFQALRAGGVKAGRPGARHRGVRRGRLLRRAARRRPRRRTSPGSAARPRPTWCARSAPSDVVDHTTTPLDTLGERFDVVLDIAGHRPVRPAARACSPSAAAWSWWAARTRAAGSAACSARWARRCCRRS